MFRPHRLVSLRRVVALSGLLPSLLSTASPARAQDGAGWNQDRALSLMERTREVRQSTASDTAMRAYRADALGYVYFFLDRPDEAERTLIKADQIALEVYWRAPNQAKQRIVGLRDQKVLPTNIRYHLDHLTVVQDEFGDLIRLGDGDEVAAVLHPAAPESGSWYDFRLADSLTLSFGGTREALRVYEIEVRPKDLDSPGFVGSLFLDRSSAAIVRMNFTFTPASYVDPHLDYIRISLDNGLWLDRFWLPYRQEVELRRELPVLDFLAGSIIRGRFEIGRYEFNPTLPEGLFNTRGVSAVPEEQRRAYPFEESIFADLEAEGLAASPALEDIEAQVRTLVAGRALSGLRRFRLHLPSFSEGIRYDRAEGLFVGMGFAFRPRPEWAWRLHGGWAFGREDGSARLEVEYGGARPHTNLTLEVDALRDLGPTRAASGALNTLATLGGDDYLDPFFASGVRLEHRFGGERGPGLSLSLVYERHQSASRVVGDALSSLRPVRSVEEGWLRAADITLLALDADQGGRVALTGRVGRINGRSYLTGRVDAGWRREAVYQALEVDVSLSAGLASADSPAQEFYLLGGRATIPGHDFRAQAGNRFWLASGRVGRSLAAPWVDLHLFGSAGQASLSDRGAIPLDWPDPVNSVRASAGAGLDLFWEVVRIDLAHGLGSAGEWELLLAFNHRFHRWL